VGHPQETEEWQVVSDASHELRTPLTALRAEVELALVRGEQLAGYVARTPDPHKRPRAVHFVDELPHDALGKVQKNRLPPRG
jgi:acyl-coenzyme A synthetase/AMP-(fatty) acid ligase